jgi:hypothetical protein
MKKYAVLTSMIVAVSVAASVAGAASYDVRGLKQLSVDTFTNSTSQHRTEVEPDTFAYGTTEVSVFQVGRFFDGGASDIGWATSTDGGATWHNGFLPGITKIQDPRAQYDRASDPSIAYDAKHGRWLAASLPLINVSSGAIGQVPVISGSADGLHWGNPVKVAPDNGDFMDKEWIACDNGASSKYLGRCYVEYDDAYTGEILMSTSKDGGLTWSTPFHTGAGGLGGQPLAQPNGVAVVPYFDGANIGAFSSKDGGASWGSNVLVAAVSEHGVAGGLRTQPLPSAEIDGGGTIYVVWQDCSFRPGCSSNDIVMSTSSDGIHWSSVARVPIDKTSSTVDHFIPGIAVDPATTGSGAHLALTYYYYPNANCVTAACLLYVGYVGSKNAGATWSAPMRLTRAMSLSWLANTNQGFMVGDYISTSFIGGVAHAAFAVASKPVAGSFREAMATSAAGLPAFGFGEYSSAGERPIRGAHSDRPRRIRPTAY